MTRQATTRVTPSIAGADDVRHAEVGRLGDERRRAPSPTSIATPPTDLGPAEDLLEAAR